MNSHHHSFFTSSLLRMFLLLVRLPLFAINSASVAVFYMLALTKFIRYSDIANDLRGMNGAVISMHEYVLPYVDIAAISKAYGTPIYQSTLDLKEAGASVRMRLNAATADLNAPTGSGSAKFYANWGLGTLNVTMGQLPALCDVARAATTGKYEQFNTSTTVLHKPNVDGGQLNLWAGVQHLPTTIKATTQVVTLKVSVNNPTSQMSSGCLYRMKLYHAEAFELWNQEMATFNILQTDLQINDTDTPVVVTTTDTNNVTTTKTSTPKPLAWIFDPRETQLNWFFYRRQSSTLTGASLLSQLVGFALLFSSGRRVISLKTKHRTTQSTYTTMTPNSDREIEFNGDDTEVTVTKRIAHHEVDPTASQGLYYNSLIINVAEIYIILNDRYMIFRCINALDFFMTAKWGFSLTNMWIEYINIMGSIFWLILGLHKLLSLTLYVLAKFFWKCSRRVKWTTHSTTKLSNSKSFVNGNLKVASSDGEPGSKNSRVYTTARKQTEPWLVFIKEATRPRPDLIVFLMILFPKFFYAHFFGGATAWAPVDLPTTTSLASNLGANLLIANTLCCGVLIFPINAIFVLVAMRHLLGNGWMILRQPGRVYYQRLTFCRYDREVYSFDEGKIDSLFTLLYFQVQDWVRRHGRQRYLAEPSITEEEKDGNSAESSTFAQSNSSTELCVSLRFHDIIHDSLVGELQAYYGVVRAEDVDKAHMRFVEHTPCPSPFRFFPVVVIAEYGNRGVLLAWPGIATSIRGINNMDFARMFLGRIHLIGSNYHPSFVQKQLLTAKE